MGREWIEIEDREWETRVSIASYIRTSLCSFVAVFRTLKINRRNFQSSFTRYCYSDSRVRSVWGRAVLDFGRTRRNLFHWNGLNRIHRESKGLQAENCVITSRRTRLTSSLDIHWICPITLEMLHFYYAATYIVNKCSLVQNLYTKYYCK